MEWRCIDRPSRLASEGRRGRSPGLRADRRLLPPLPPRAWLATILIGASTVGSPEVGAVEDQLDALRAWGREMVASDRVEQLGVRFDPLAQRWLASGRLDQAADLLALWTELEPGAAGAWRRLGEARLEQQAFEPALDAFRAHREVTGETVLGEALALWELGRPDQAGAAFERVLETDRSLFARFQWARFLAWSGRADESWKEYAALLDVDGQRPEVVLEAAKVCAETSTNGACSPAEAAALFESAVALLPVHAEARYGLARALQRAGRLGAAREEMEVYRRLLEEDQRTTARRGRAEARARRAQELVLGGDLAGARELVCSEPDCAAPLAGRGPDELKAMALILRGLERREEALRALELLLAAAPDRGDARWLLERWRREE